jgi:hypothetical protein
MSSNQLRTGSTTLQQSPIGLKTVTQNIGHSTMSSPMYTNPNALKTFPMVSPLTQANTGGVRLATLSTPTSLQSNTAALSRVPTNTTIVHGNPNVVNGTPHSNPSISTSAVNPLSPITIVGLKDQTKPSTG